MVRSHVYLVLLLIVLSMTLTASLAGHVADSPESVRTHLVRAVPDLNKDCVRDTMVLAQLANGATRILAIRWGIVADTLDVCDSLKRVSKPLPKYPELVFAYRLFTRPRSAITITTIEQGTDYAAVLRVYGHLHQTDTGTVYPRMYRVSADRYFDQIDTIVVDDVDSMELVDNMLPVHDTIDTTALAAFKYGVYDVRILPENVQYRREVPSTDQGRRTIQSEVSVRRPTQVQIVGNVHQLQGTLRALPARTRIRVYSMLGEVLREFAGSDPSPDLSDDRLPPGTYMVVASDGARVTLVHVWQKGG